MNKNSCYYCSCPLTDDNRTIDHVIPKSRGGSNKKDNKVWCCLYCNKKKGDMTVDEFMLYKALKRTYKGHALRRKCRELGILLEPNDRKKRNRLDTLFNKGVKAYGNKTVS